VKRQAVWLMVAMLSIGTTAQAQKTYSAQSCKGVEKAVPYSDGEWATMTMDQRLKACERDGVVVPTTPDPLATGSSTGSFNTLRSEPRIRSRGMVIAGVISAIAGVAMIIPGGTTYHIFGDDVCVTTYSVDAGGCRSVAPVLGAGLLGGGILLAYAGSRPVTVSPMIGPNVKGASVKIKWGSHARN
jgi:hypothetical protein